MTDIAALVGVAHAAGVPLIVDNTVSRPYLCRSFEHGADIVVHALTKYLGGHGTTLGGGEFTQTVSFGGSKRAYSFLTTA